MKNMKSNKKNKETRYSLLNKRELLDTIMRVKNVAQSINIKLAHKQQFDLLAISSILILGYALMRSGTFLFFYLIIWNIIPNSQYYLIYNPIPFEIYLLLLSFFIGWYSLRLLISFPKQFQIHLWIFQRVVIDNLDYFSKRYIGKNYNILEMVWLFLFFLLVCCWPKYGLFLIWFMTFFIELYCLDNLRKPQILLFTPKWIKFLDDFGDTLNNELSESDDILPEEDFSLPSFSPVWELWEHEEDTSEPQSQPNVDFNVEDFEAFFAEYTFIPPTAVDFYEDEFKDGWVNWFWLNLFYKVLPLLCFCNIIICICFFIFGIPEYFFVDMQIADLVIQDFLAEYQRMLLVYTNAQWSSSWKWLIGGLGFRAYFKKYAANYFQITGDISADNLFNDYKKYSKYTYYINHELSRQGKIYSQLFPFYFGYTQLKNFFFKMRDFSIPLRETYLHKFFFYDDLFLYQQLLDTIPLTRSKKGISRKKKQEIMSWLLYRTKTWAKDYYFTAPASHIFPEKHYNWLDLLRFLFVVEELDLSMHATLANIDLWLSEDTQLEYDPEIGQHFLEHFLYDFGDPEIWVDFDAYEFDNELYTTLKQPLLSTSYVNYFSEAHPLSDPIGTLFRTLGPQLYLNYFTGKFNAEPDYVTQEFYDIGSTIKGKFTYFNFDISETDLDKVYEHHKKRFIRWIEPEDMDMYSVYKFEPDWNIEFEDEDSDFFKMDLNQTNDYEILSSYYHQANLDILPDLLQDMDPVQLQNKTFFSYVLRNDSLQYPNRRRSFLYNEMLQLFTYAATFQRYSRYNPADLFEILETTPNVFFGQSRNVTNLYILGNLTKFTSEYDKKYIKGYDSRATRSELFKAMNDTNWYKYYYKVDTVMNYYDYMPSYRKFFMKTWPIEYIASPYNFFGKIDTVSLSENCVFLDDGWIIYIPNTTDALFFSAFNSSFEGLCSFEDPFLFFFC